MVTAVASESWMCKGEQDFVFQDGVAFIPTKVAHHEHTVKKPPRALVCFGPYNICTRTSKINSQLTSCCLPSHAKIL